MLGSTQKLFTMVKAGDEHTPLLPAGLPEGIAEQVRGAQPQEVAVELGTEEGLAVERVARTNIGSLHWSQYTLMAAIALVAFSSLALAFRTYMFSIMSAVGEAGVSARQFSANATALPGVASWQGA